MHGVGIGGQKPTIIGHALNLANRIDEHEIFWTTIFSRTTDVCVITTNYDILVERGLRLTPRTRLPRPGFNYGSGREHLLGRGYPAVFRSRPPIVDGTVPVLKLHGSVSWSVSENRLNRYHDCRPAIRGDAAIIAPVTEKSIPSTFRTIWDHAASALAKSETWIIVGYSFPEYDKAVNGIFQSNASHRPRAHILNPDPSAVARARALLPDINVCSHDGIPNALDDLRRIVEKS